MFADILTDRLLLRDLRSANAETMSQYRSDPENSQYQGWGPAATAEKPATAEQLRSYFLELASRDLDTPGRWYQIAIALRSTDRLIGDCGIHILTDSRIAEIGITLSPQFHYCGYPTEALSAILKYLFATLGKHRIFASVDPCNIRSVRLLQRIGFRKEAHMVQSLWFKGEWVDDVIFAMLAAEWAQAAKMIPQYKAQ